MHNESKLLRFLLRSPVAFIVFIITPTLLITSLTFHIKLPFHITWRMLMLNNGGALLLIAARFLYYLSGLRRAIRYGENGRPSGNGLTEARPAVQIRDELVKGGFQWHTNGAYAEKHERGYLGTTLIYAGLFLILFLGTWENMNQFSGTLLQGIGIPADLSKRGAFYPVAKGPLASTFTLPMLEVTQQFFPSKEYPKGATEIVLSDKKGTQLGKTILYGSGAPYRYRGYDIYLSKLLADAGIRISLKENGKGRQIFYDQVKFLPLPKNDTGYSMSGDLLGEGGHKGEVLYDPLGRKFRFILDRDGKRVMDMVYTMYQYRTKTDGNYTVELTALGHWSELHVVHRRHLWLLWIGGVIAIIGLALRTVIRPQRVWLEETPEGCRVWTVGKEAERRLAVRG